MCSSIYKIYDKFGFGFQCFLRRVVMFYVCFIGCSDLNFILCFGPDPPKEALRGHLGHKLLVFDLFPNSEEKCVAGMVPACQLMVCATAPAILPCPPTSQPKPSNQPASSAQLLTWGREGEKASPTQASQASSSQPNQPSKLNQPSETAGPTHPAHRPASHGIAEDG